ncbi:MAG TPA: tyrosine-type recombinase/integrase [Actinomycetota bacterium]|nr:tyrosine-type recombinase/integrase [Actinomycetota bacterium]
MSRRRYPIPNPRGQGYIVRWRTSEGHHRQRTFLRKRDAEDFVNELGYNRRRDASYDPARGRILLADYWPRFLAGLESRDGAPPAPSTIDLYRTHARLWVIDGLRLPEESRLGPRRLCDLTPEHVRAWRAAMREAGAGEPTVNACTRLLKAVLNRAVADGRIFRSPAQAVRNPAADPDGGMRVLEPEQVRALADAHPERYRALVFLLAYRGLRIGEAAALKVGDLDLMRGRVRVDESLSDTYGLGATKTRRTRTVTLPPFPRPARGARGAVLRPEGSRGLRVHPTAGRTAQHPELPAPSVRPARAQRPSRPRAHGARPS